MKTGIIIANIDSVTDVTSKIVSGYGYKQETNYRYGAIDNMSAYEHETGENDKTLHTTIALSFRGNNDIETSHINITDDNDNLIKSYKIKHSLSGSSIRTDFVLDG